MRFSISRSMSLDLLEQAETLQLFQCCRRWARVHRDAHLCAPCAFEKWPQSCDGGVELVVWVRAASVDQNSRPSLRHSESSLHSSLSSQTESLLSAPRVLAVLSCARTIEQSMNRAHLWGDQPKSVYIIYSLDYRIIIVQYVVIQ